MRSVIASSIAVAVLVAAPPPAAACSLFSNVPLVIGGDGTDPVAPTAPVVDYAEVGWTAAGGTCDDLAAIELGVSANGAGGFQFALRSGALPDGLVLPAEPVRPMAAPHLYFYFDYDDSSVAFELEVRAVDASGNRSEPTVVALEGERSGCAAGRSRPQALAPVLIALALLVARRRAGGHTGSHDEA